MTLTSRIKHSFQKLGLIPADKVLDSAVAYDEWAKTYDQELDTGNLTVFYNDQLIVELLSQVDIEGMVICDFGTGTGRHAQKVLDQNPKRWVGCDISQGMLDKLKQHIPTAEVYKVEDHQLYFLEDASLDILFSSLTIGHISHIEDSLKEWNRVLKPGGSIVISMFHPDLAQLKAARSFKNKEGKLIIIESHQHKPSKLNQLFSSFNWTIRQKQEIKIDKQAKAELERIGKAHLYDELLGKPLVLGYVLSKS